MEEMITLPELLLRPAFSVQNGCISRLNREAANYMLTEGTPVRELIITGLEEYEAFSDGLLCLTLLIADQRVAATVLSREDGQLFILEQDAQEEKLQSMPLIAQELRVPLTGLMASAEQLLPAVSAQDTQTATQMYRRIYQLLRIVNNLSDTPRLAAKLNGQEYVDIAVLLDEIFHRAGDLVHSCRRTLLYEGLSQSVFTLADRDLLERAVYNLLSNAIKFSPEGSTIHAQLRQSGKSLRLTLENTSEMLDANVQRNIFSYYLRTPGLEDPRHGLGLGMVIVRSAASQHGGTVLIDQPAKDAVRVTMTIAIRRNTDAAFRTPIMRIDYTGERDHGLIELADVLPAEAFQSELLD